MYEALSAYLGTKMVSVPGEKPVGKLPLNGGRSVDRSTLDSSSSVLFCKAKAASLSECCVCVDGDGGGCGGHGLRRVSFRSTNS